MGNVFRLFIFAIFVSILVGCGGNRAGNYSQTPAPVQPAAGPTSPIPSLDQQNKGEVLPAPVDDAVFQDDPVHQNNPGGNLPGFPGSDGDTFSPVHMVSEAEYQTPGDGFVDSFGANNRAGVVEGEYVLIPEEGGIAWAMYTIPDLTGDRPVRIDVAVSPAELEAGSGEGLLLSYWLGVADYTLYHWDWYGPFTGHQELVINSDELKDRYVDKNGTLHWVAVLYGDEEGGLPGVTLQSGTVVTDPDYVTNNPHYTLVNSITVGGASESSKVSSALDPSQYIQIVWDHVKEFGPHDVQNKAFEYKIYRRGPLDLNPQEIDSVPSPQNVYIDDGEYLLTIPPIPLPIPGAEYSYYIQALNLIGGYSPLSTPKVATAPLLPPEGLLATDGDPSDRVTLTWDAAEGATSYEVFRENQDTPIATVSDIDATPASPEFPEDREWNDYSVPDFNLQTYWLKAVNIYASSDFSTPDLGYIIADPLAGLTILPGQENGTAPHLVNFDASASNDPDGGDIVTYDWDWEGDGTIDESGSAAVTEHTYVADGSFSPTVRVTDDEGDSGEAFLAVSVNDAPVADLQAIPLSGNQPLAVEFDASGSVDPNGEITKYEFDFDDGAGWEDYGLNATQSYEYDDGTYTAKVRVTDDVGETDEATVEITVNNTAPIADLQADPLSGNQPLTVNFDASGSTDSDGTIVLYEYDFDEGAGWGDYGTNTTPTHEYTDPGTYTATVRVTDNDGATNTDSVTITMHGWIIETVDSQNVMGGRLAIALDSSDNPHISYYDDIDDDLKYAYFDGSSWNKSTVASAGGWESSIAVDRADNLHISYYHQMPSGDLKYAFHNGSSWQLETVDSEGNLGHDNSIALDSENKPHISYYTTVNTGLKYAYYNGTSWEQETVDSEGTVGSETSIALDSSDRPHICYFHASSKNLKYAYYDGASWQIETVESTGAVGYWPSIAVDSFDKPHIGYMDDTNDDLKYAYYNGTFWEIEIVDNGALVGSHVSIALDTADNPHVSYHDWGTQDLKYAYDNGTSWDIQTVDSEGNVGKWTSIALDSADNPHIAYFDETNLDLKYAHYE